MHITILTIGTRGDVQPYIALGLGLKQAGHRIKIGAPENFKDFVTGYGLDFTAIGTDFKKMVSSDAFNTIMEPAKKGHLLHWIRTARKIHHETADYYTNAYPLMWQAVQGTDLLILQLLALPAADFAQKLGIPVVYAGLQPATPTSDFPLIGIGLPSLGPWLNRASYFLLRNLNQIPRKHYNRMRRELLDFPPRRRLAKFHYRNGKPIPALYGFSRHLVPRPKDWPEQTRICGFWFLDDDHGWQPDDGLKAFLAAGEAPVFIGFSSLPWQAEKHTKTVVEGIRKWGGRAIIAKGWGGIDPHRFHDDLSDTIFVIENAPHSKLFPLMAAIVHHGGAGSTGAALRAGKPTLVCPHMVDQPFWARQVYKLGVGPKPAPLYQLTPDILAKKLDELTTTPGYREQAQTIAKRMESENGVENTVQAINTIATHHES